MKTEAEMAKMLVRSHETVNRERTSTDALLTERGRSHGDYSEQSRVTQHLKREIQKNIDWQSTTLADFQRDALDMFCVKLGRIIAGDPAFKDHWEDIAGYAKLVADRL